MEVVFRDFESNRDKRNKTARLVDMMDSNGTLWENMKLTEKDAFDITVLINPSKFGSMHYIPVIVNLTLRSSEVYAQVLPFLCPKAPPYQHI